MDDGLLIGNEDLGSTRMRAREVRGEVLTGPERRRRWSVEADTNGAARLHGKTLNHRQSQTGAAPYLFRREERVECLSERCFVHAGSVVADRYDDIVAGCQLWRGVAIGTTVREGYAHRAAFGHRIASIDRQIENGELDLIGIDMRRCQVWIGRDHQTNLRSQCSSQQHLDAGDQATEVERSRSEALLAGEGEEALDQGCAASSRLQRRLQQWRYRGGFAGPHARQLEVADDRGQQIVEIMRDTRTQQPDGLHLLCLMQLGLDRGALGD